MPLLAGKVVYRRLIQGNRPGSCALPVAAVFSGNCRIAPTFGVTREACRFVVKASGAAARRSLQHRINFKERRLRFPIALASTRVSAGRRGENLVGILMDS